MGRLPRLEWYNWELCAESLEISESDNVIVCTMINETLSAKTRMQAHYLSLNWVNYKPTAKMKSLSVCLLITSNFSGRNCKLIEKDSTFQSTFDNFAEVHFIFKNHFCRNILQKLMEIISKKKSNLTVLHVFLNIKRWKLHSKRGSIICACFQSTC